MIAAPVHAYTAEDCHRGYRIYNHPSKGEQQVPVSMRYCPIEGTNPQPANMNATLDINSGMMTLTMPPARVVRGTTMRTNKINVKFSDVLNIVGYRDGDDGSIKEQSQHNDTEIYGAPHGSANYARGDCRSGDQISAANQSGQFKQIGEFKWTEWGSTKQFDMNKFLCGNPQPGTTFRVEFRGAQGGFRRDVT